MLEGEGDKLTMPPNPFVITGPTKVNVSMLARRLNQELEVILESEYESLTTIEVAIILYSRIEIINFVVNVGTSSFLISGLSKVVVIKMYCLIPIEVVKNIQFFFLINVFIFIFIKFHSFVD